MPIQTIQRLLQASQTFLLNFFWGVARPYVDHPKWMAGEAPMTAFRRWIKLLYPLDATT